VAIYRRSPCSIFGGGLTLIDGDEPQGKILSLHDELVESTPQHHREEHVNSAARDEFERDVLAGLDAKPKTLPCKYFYDTKGSQLFARICETPEYYVTRTELSILREACPKVARIIGPGAQVIEPGAGAGEKIRILLDSLDSPDSFIPIDISKSAVFIAAQKLRESYPQLRVSPLAADFTKQLILPNFSRKRVKSKDGADSRSSRVIFFPGSTLSNFAPNEAAAFLTRLRQVLVEGDFLFIGVDRIKDTKTLENAYDDAAGITAQFNLNLLERIKTELDSNLDISSFFHRATYNRDESRIEMHLESRVAQRVRVSDKSFSFAAGETIHTENSYKYSPTGFASLANSSGFSVAEVFSDPHELFSLYLCAVTG